MQSGYTHMCLILDRSGSMEAVRTETIQGVNQFLADQKKVPGTATLTLVQFDGHEPYEVLCEFKALKKVKNMTSETYVPRGYTPLYDAIGMGIDKTGEILSGMKEEDRPEKVIFIIMTDGQENASQKYRREQIKSMIQHQTDTYSWKFVFLGANQDAFLTSQSLGIALGSTLSVVGNSVGTTQSFMSMSRGMAAYRCAEPGAAATANYFDNSDRDIQANAGAPAQSVK